MIGKLPIENLQRLFGFMVGMKSARDSIFHVYNLGVDGCEHSFNARLFLDGPTHFDQVRSPLGRNRVDRHTRPVRQLDRAEMKNGLLGRGKVAIEQCPGAFAAVDRRQASDASIDGRVRRQHNVVRGIYGIDQVPFDRLALVHSIAVVDLNP
jgi:hypothetical protein